MLSKYRPVLTLPGAPRLFASALLARFPQGMAPLAVLLLVRGATHSYAAAGLAVGAEALATAAAAPVLGRIVDQVGRRRVLAPLAGGQAVVYVLLVVAADAHAGVPVLVVLAGLGGALLPPVAPVVRVLLREVFEDPAVRETAYSLRGGGAGARLRLRAADRRAADRVHLGRARGGAARRRLRDRDRAVPELSDRARCGRRGRAPRRGRKPDLGARQPRAAGPTWTSGADRNRPRSRRGGAAGARHPRRLAPRVGPVARAMEPGQHGRRAVVRLARVALAARAAAIRCCSS